MPSRVTRQPGGDDYVIENLTARPKTPFLLLFVVLLPAAAAYGILFRQALPAPYQDDYAVVLNFAANYDRLPGFNKKVLYIATVQVNEYKLGFEHTIVASEMEISRHLNFLFLTTLGNLFLLPIGFLLWRTYQNDGRDLNGRLLEFLPISFLFFSLTYWENLNWATTDLQNIPIVFFSFLSVYLLCPRKMVQPARTRLLLACVAAALAAFTSANGFLLGPLGFFIFLRRRAYGWSLLWCAGFILPLAAYLYHFTPQAHPVHKFFYLTRPLFFLAFLGCGAVPFRWPAAMLGLVIVAILWLAVRTRVDRTNPVAFYFTMWIVGTALLVGWVRGAVSFTIASRYSIYSILLLIFCYSFLAQYLAQWSTFNRRRYYVTCLVLAVSLCSLADIHAYEKLGARRRMVLTGIEFYRANPQVNSPMIDPDVTRGFPKEQAYEQVTLTNAIQNHIYSLPPKQESR